LGLTLCGPGRSGSSFGTGLQAAGAQAVAIEGILRPRVIYLELGLEL
jgi:aldehyde:ferredoxin oxidoreductase